MTATRTTEMAVPPLALSNLNSTAITQPSLGSAGVVWPIAITAPIQQHVSNAVWDTLLSADSARWIA